jgi:hypothetical protein
MRSIGRTFAAGAVLIALTAMPGEAQTYRWDVGLNGGYSWYSPMVDRDAFDTNVRFRDGWLLGGQVGFWPTSRLGLRANATYADRPLVGAAVTTGDRMNLIEHVNLWSGSGDVLFRLTEPNVAWQGTEWLPFLSLGLGAKWINPAGDRHQLSLTNETWSGDAFQTATTAGVAGPMMALPEQRRLMGLVGVGTDLRVAPNFAIRLEVNDRIYRPTVYTVTPVTGTQFAVANDGRNAGRIVHELSGQIGIHLLGGLMPPPPVAVAPAPPPPPPPAPTPPPVPREDDIMVCVIDPASPEGVRMQSAVFRHAQADTVVMVQGQRVPLRQSVEHVPVAREAGWYVRGEPLVLTVGTMRHEFVTYETPRQIMPEQLTYLGRVNGYPVYADRDQAHRVADELAAARRAHPDHDLALMLADRRPLRDAVADIPVLYVPMQPVGCVFQAVLRSEDVRKGR